MCDQLRMFIAFVLYSPDRIPPPIRFCLVMTSCPGKGFEGVSAKNCFIKNTIFKILIAFSYLSCNCICVWIWEGLFTCASVQMRMNVLSSTHACRGIKSILLYLGKNFLHFLGTCLSEPPESLFLWAMWWALIFEDQTWPYISHHLCTQSHDEHLPLLVS